MSNQRYLQRLEQQLSQLEHTLSRLEQKSISQPRFDRHLFVTHSTRFNDYVSEVRQNLHLLQQEVASNHLQQVHFLSQRILNQVSALQREQATLTLRNYDRVTEEKSNMTLYQRLSEHREYERRLQQMIQDRETLLHHKPNSSTLLARELASLEGRLQRCRQAIKKTEKQIDFNERKA